MKKWIPQDKYEQKMQMKQQALEAEEKKKALMESIDYGPKGKIVEQRGKYQKITEKPNSLLSADEIDSVADDIYVSGRIRGGVLKKLREGNIEGMVDKDGNFFDRIYILSEEGKRKKIVFNRFCKTASVDVRKLPITKADFYYLAIISNSIDRNNTINFDDLIQTDRSFHSVDKVRPRLEKAGLIGRVKLFHSTKWYVNPFYCTKSKTVDTRLFKFFFNKIDYALKF